MIEIFSTVSGKIHTEEMIKPGCWVRLVFPTDDELNYVCRELGLNPSDLKVLLDEEELPRLEIEDDYTLILV
ncbi:MAG: magnesium transporter CorA family protein, partial [Methanocorpusculum sp.]|nr:magnesium transporter CorA family protein [Methanocorpusculum sp.]